MVRSIDRGETLFERGGDRKMIVASNNKLMTSASVLVHLGSDFAFTTLALVADRPGADGVVHGDLVVRGDGDPDIDVAGREPLCDRLVRAIRAAGVTRVTGDVVIDDRIFDDVFTPTGWSDAHEGKAYGAPVSGFSLNENCIAVAVTPGASPGSPATVVIHPESTSFPVSGIVTTGPAKSKHLIHVPTPVAIGTVTVRGSTPHGSRPYPVRVPLAAPTRAAAVVVADALRRAGVQVDGKARTIGDAGASEPRQELARVEAPLAPALHRMNKDSSNVTAEHLFKRAGAAFEGVGSFESGARAVAAALVRLEIPVGDGRSVDGSGLSRQNRWSPDQLVRVLDRLYRSPLRDAFLASLAAAGVDGTLEHRLSDAAYRGRVRAKTGYIASVSALSGFAQTDHGEVLAFAIVFNGFSGPNRTMKSLMDRICRLLVDLADV